MACVKECLRDKERSVGQPCQVHLQPKLHTHTCTGLGKLRYQVAARRDSIIVSARHTRVPRRRSVPGEGTARQQIESSHEACARRAFARQTERARERERERDRERAPVIVVRKVAAGSVARPYQETTLMLDHHGCVFSTEGRDCLAPLVCVRFGWCVVKKH